MMNINKEVQVKSFIETKLTLMKLIYLRIVSIQSAGTYSENKINFKIYLLYIYIFILNLI